MRSKIKSFLIFNKIFILIGCFLIGIAAFVLLNWSSIYLSSYAVLAPYQYYSKKLGIDHLLKTREPFVFFGKVPVLAPRSDKTFFFEFNGERVYESKKDNEFRIMIVGGTNASGKGVSNLNERFYKVFENKLNQTSNRFYYRVFSAGVEDYVSGQIVMQLQLGLLHFKPDMIIYIDGYMDLIAHKVYGQPPGLPRFFLEYQKFLEIAWALDSKVPYHRGKERITKKEHIDHILSSNEILNKDGLKRGKIKKIVRLQIAENNFNVLRIYERNLNSFMGISREYQIPMVLVYPPIYSYKKSKTPDELVNCDSYCNLISILFSTNNFKEFTYTAKKSAAFNKTKFISLINLFKGSSEEIFIDSFSLNKSGQEDFGMALFDLLEEEIIEEK